MWRMLITIATTSSWGPCLENSKTLRRWAAQLSSWPLPMVSLAASRLVRSKRALPFAVPAKGVRPQQGP